MIIISVAYIDPIMKYSCSSFKTSKSVMYVKCLLGRLVVTNVSISVVITLSKTDCMKREGGTRHEA